MKVTATLTAAIAATIFSFSPAVAVERCGPGYAPATVLYGLYGETQILTCCPLEMKLSEELIIPKREVTISRHDGAMNGERLYGVNHQGASANNEAPMQRQTGRQCLHSSGYVSPKAGGYSEQGATISHPATINGDRVHGVNYPNPGQEPIIYLNEGIFLPNPNLQQKPASQPRQVIRPPQEQQQQEPISHSDEDFFSAFVKADTDRMAVEVAAVRAHAAMEVAREAKYNYLMAVIEALESAQEVENWRMFMLGMDFHL